MREGLVAGARIHVLILSNAKPCTLRAEWTYPCRHEHRTAWLRQRRSTFGGGQSSSECVCHELSAAATGKRQRLYAYRTIPLLPNCRATRQELQRLASVVSKSERAAAGEARGYLVPCGPEHAA